MSLTREGEVLARLDRVSDPELDEPVTELGFVTAVAVDEAGAVRIGFRLPTYWCAANFAFLMADDMHREVTALPWVTSVDVHLADHMNAEEINRGVARRLSFADSFAGSAEPESDALRDDNLDTLRRIFLVKAFQRRQDAVLRRLLADGRAAEDILPLSIAGLRALTDGDGLVARYLDRRFVVGPVGDADPAFVDADGAPIAADTLGLYLRGLRRVAVNVEFNGALCRGLLAARTPGSLVDPHPGPTLVDFIQALPARA